MGALLHSPHPDSIAASVKKINYQNVILSEVDTSVFLKEKGMKIGFGAIGKGYVRSSSNGES